MSSRYGREARPGGRTHQVYSGIHGDAYEALEDWRGQRGLTVSGAVHHIIRSFFNLDPLQPINDK